MKNTMIMKKNKTVKPNVNVGNDNKLEKINKTRKSFTNGKLINNKLPKTMTINLVDRLIKTYSLLGRESLRDPSLLLIFKIGTIPGSSKRSFELIKIRKKDSTIEIRGILKDLILYVLISLLSLLILFKFNNSENDIDELTDVIDDKKDVIDDKKDVIEEKKDKVDVPVNLMDSFNNDIEIEETLIEDDYSITDLGNLKEEFIEDSTLTKDDSTQTKESVNLSQGYSEINSITLDEEIKLLDSKIVRLPDNPSESFSYIRSFLDNKIFSLLDNKIFSLLDNTPVGVDNTPARISKDIQTDPITMVNKDNQTDPLLIVNRDNDKDSYTQTKILTNVSTGNQTNSFGINKESQTDISVNKESQSDIFSVYKESQTDNFKDSLDNPRDSSSKNELLNKRRTSSDLSEISDMSDDKINDKLKSVSHNTDNTDNKTHNTDNHDEDKLTPLERIDLINQKILGFIDDERNYRKSAKEAFLRFERDIGLEFPSEDRSDSLESTRSMLKEARDIETQALWDKLKDITDEEEREDYIKMMHKIEKINSANLYTKYTVQGTYPSDSSNPSYFISSSSKLEISKSDKQVNPLDELSNNSKQSSIQFLMDVFRGYT